MYFTTSDIQARRKKLEARWNEQLAGDEAVLVYSGEPIQKPGGLDQTYPFLTHPAYFWLTGRRRESEVVLYNKNTGWVEFQKEIGPDEAVWEGDRHDLLVNDRGQSRSELDSFLANNKFSNVYKLGQALAPVEGKAFELRTSLDRERRKKDAAEVRLFQQLAEIAKHGYEKIAQVIRPGVTEREIQVAYEGEILTRGAHGVPYETIVGAGTNSAILHAIPTHRKVNEGEYVLIDAGAEIYDYCVDITRMYHSTNNPTQQHKDLYQLVLKAHAECIAMSKRGVMWRDVHLHAARVTTEGLLGLGLLKGNLDTLLEKEVSSVFFPHGVGHLVGLRVRDAGQEENINPKMYAGARLRVDIELEAGHFITVEPGCYFISALLDSENVRSKFANEINWDEVNKWKHIGGVRIEDDILITANGNDNLTIGVEKTDVYN
ncbi:aminopeptidase P N-terminal domain-containing protein [Polluticoccus soli]|uniref:aminopeptidase P N-terminal domain-containing protein n=1 Tax=Polluticoccus soli TaxID=3034150 RepID=UPI0023E17D5E|nr:aminopeptidase P N-terminal domain-containing protein [Flavipsychrobacter sp. JY13-12]